MNPIEDALRQIHSNIPSEILDLAFRPRIQRRSIDDCIQTEVIHRVRLDCSITGGMETVIVLKPEYVEASSLPNPYTAFNTNTSVIYRIPPAERQNRAISDCISVSYPVGYGSGSLFTTSGAGATVGQLACDALSSHTYAGALPTPTPIILSGDLVKLVPPTNLYVANLPWLLRCKLSYDDEFTNLNRRAVRPLANLILSACKSYIYTKLIVQIDRGFLEYGHEVGTIKDIVSSYQNEEEKYQELLNSFMGSATALDPVSLRNRIYMAL